MRRFLGIGFALVLAWAILAMGTVPARATPPMAAETSVVIHTFDFGVPRVAGGNLFLTLQTTATYSGTWNGFATTEFTIVIHQTGARSANGVVTCDCTVDGRSGNLIFQVRYLFAADGALQSSSWVFLRGTDGLAGIHGEGSLVWLDPGFLYVGQYHFDP